MDTTSDTIAIVELKAFTIAVLNTQRGPPPDGLVAFGRGPCPPVGPAASAPRPLRATRARRPATRNIRVAPAGERSAMVAGRVRAHVGMGDEKWIGPLSFTPTTAGKQK